MADEIIKKPVTEVAKEAYNNGVILGVQGGKAVTYDAKELVESNLTFGKVEKGDTNVVSGREVYDSIKDFSSGVIPINLSTETHTKNGVFEPLEVGVYTNFGGLELTQQEKDSSIVYFYLLNGVFSKQVKSVSTTDVVGPNNTNAISSRGVYNFSIRNVSNIAELRTIVGEVGQKVNLLGYYEAGDKPSLLYKWVNGTAEDDGGSVIVVGEGYWSVTKNNLNIKDFDSASSFFKYIKTKDISVVDLSDSIIEISVNDINKLYFENKENIHFNFTNCTIKNDTEYNLSLVQNNFIELIRCNNVTSEGELVFYGKRTETKQGEDYGCNVVFINECDGVNLSINSIGNRCAVAFFQSIDVSKYSRDINIDIKCKNNHYPSVIYNVINSKITIYSINSYRSVFAMGLQNSYIKCYTSGQVGASILKAYHNNIPFINNEVHVIFEDINPYTPLYPITFEYQTDLAKEVSNNIINININHKNENNKLINGVIGLSNMNVNGSVRSNSVGHIFKNNNINISGELKNVSNVIRFPMHTNKYAFFDSDNIGDNIFKIKIKSNEELLNTLNLKDSNIKYNVEVVSENCKLKSESNKAMLITSNSRFKGIDSNTEAIVKINDSIIYDIQGIDRDNVHLNNVEFEEYFLNRKGGDSKYQVTSGFRGDLSNIFTHSFKGTIRANCRLHVYAVKDINNPLLDYVSGYFDFILYQTLSGSSAYRNITWNKKISSDSNITPTFNFLSGVKGEIGVKIPEYNTVNSKITTTLDVEQYITSNNQYTLIK